MGTFAIQLAKHLGATVATTTSASNIDLVRGLGADVIVDYKTDDFEARLSGYDLVLHSQDGKALEKSLRVLGRGGRLVAALIEAGAVRPVVDKVFPFQRTNDALAYVEAGRAKGKVVIKVK